MFEIQVYKLGMWCVISRFDNVVDAMNSCMYMLSWISYRVVNNYMINDQSYSAVLLESIKSVEPDWKEFGF